MLNFIKELGKGFIDSFKERGCDQVNIVHNPAVEEYCRNGVHRMYLIKRGKDWTYQCEECGFIEKK